MMLGMTLSIVHMLIPRNHGLLTSEAKPLTPRVENTRPYSTAAPRRCTWDASLGCLLGWSMRLTPV